MKLLVLFSIIWPNEPFGCCQVRVMSAAQAGEALLARLSWAASVRATEHAQRRAAAAATRRHLRLAVLFAVPVSMLGMLT